MPELVLTRWHDRIHTAIDYGDPVPKNMRGRLGTVLDRAAITDREAELPLDILVPLMKLLGRIT